MFSIREANLKKEQQIENEKRMRDILSLGKAWMNALERAGVVQPLQQVQEQVQQQQPQYPQAPQYSPEDQAKINQNLAQDPRSPTYHPVGVPRFPPGSFTTMQIDIGGADEPRPPQNQAGEIQWDGRNWFCQLADGRFAWYQRIDKFRGQWYVGSEPLQAGNISTGPTPTIAY